MKLKDIAQYISEKLLQQGFIIHRYDAYSTCSIYLKLDYGVMHSIRISDHKGKAYLSYKYNIESSVKYSKWSKDKNGFWRYYCSTKKEDIDNLINIIIADKLQKKTMYKNKYNEIMESYKQQTITEKGFWQQAEKVELPYNN